MSLSTFLPRSVSVSLVNRAKQVVKTGKELRDLKSTFTHPVRRCTTSYRTFPPGRTLNTNFNEEELRAACQRHIDLFYNWFKRGVHHRPKRSLWNIPLGLGGFIAGFFTGLYFDEERWQQFISRWYLGITEPTLPPEETEDLLPLSLELISKNNNEEGDEEVIMDQPPSAGHTKLLIGVGVAALLGLGIGGYAVFGGKS